jgi:hypothetical protein
MGFSVFLQSVKQTDIKITLNTAVRIFINPGFFMQRHFKECIRTKILI